MTQLAARVQHIERLKSEKTKIGWYDKKEKLSYIIVKGYSSDDEELNDESEVSVS